MISAVLTPLNANFPTTQVTRFCTDGLQSGLHNRCKAALEHARRLSAIYTEGQIEIALAWETVDELEKAQRRYQVSRLSNF